MQNEWNQEAVLQGVMKEFSGLCRIPHPSGHEGTLAAYLTAQLNELGLAPVLDNVGNLICDVPGTKGLEQRSRLILQAHMDMVCVGTSDYDPLHDPIHPVLRGGYLCTDGRSSLGADCGIGLSSAMYLVRQQHPHVPLRLIFTVSEEHGLSGAKELSPDTLEGCAGLINLDCFHFGELMISSAGGCRQTFHRTPDRFFPMLDYPAILEISGLTGGHSGDDIGSGHANAAQLLLWLLQAIETPYELAAVDAGTQHNAIPSHGQAQLVMDARDLDAVTALIAQFQQDACAMYPADPGITVTLRPADMPAMVLTVDERDDFLALGGLIPCGVQSMHPLIPAVVGSSGNLGRLYLDGEHMELQSFLRSCNDGTMQAQSEFLSLAAQGFGYQVESDTYPAWPGVQTDPLSELFLREGAKMGLSFKKNAVHVGLEPSIFHKLSPALPMISAGMDIFSPHSVHERVRLSTIAPFTLLLGECIAHW